jgi:peptidoglycan/LPS O-acetylase OafA/YrhL
MSIPIIVMLLRMHGRYLVPISIFVAYVGSLRGLVLRKFLANRWVSAIGGMCYTMYLYHPYVMDWTVRLLGGFRRGYLVNVASLLPCVLVTVTLATFVLYSLFERPFMSRSGGRAAVQLDRGAARSSETA